MEEHQERTDGELLTAFSDGGDQSAFGELARRYGAMVYGVCLRVVRDHHEAEDIAQAVFLTLARKAALLRRDPSVGGWLHTVARRLAKDVRNASIRRLVREEQAMLEQPIHGETETDPGFFREQLDDAIGSLPERYRQPLVLFHLRGCPLEQTARQLRLNPNTLRTRLARAREMLHKKLVRRGVAVGSVGALTALLSAEAGAAVLPATFVSATVQAASLAAAGNLAAGVGTGVVSAKVAALTKGAANMLFWSSVKSAAVGVAAAVVVAGSGVIVAQEVAAQRKAAEQPPAAAKTVVESWAAEVGEMDLMTVKSLTVAQAESLVKWQAQKPAFKVLECTDADWRAAGATPEQIQRLGIDSFDTPPWPGEGQRPGGMRYLRFLQCATSPEWLRLGNGARQFLTLPALNTLSPEVAAVLSKLKGGEYPGGLTDMDLHLPGLTTLTPEVAAALAQFGGSLFLRGLTNLTPEVAAAFANFQGYRLVFSDLTTLTPEAGAALARLRVHAWLELYGLTTLTPEVAAALAKHAGSLRLYGLTTLTPEAAAVLAKHAGTLELSGLETLTPEAAAALSKIRGDLSLGGLTSLTPAAATALANFGGDRLSLHSLRTVTPEVATALAQFKGNGGLFIQYLWTMSPEANAVRLQWGKNVNSQCFGPNLADKMGAAVAEADRMPTLTPETAKAVVRVWSLCGLSADSLRLPRLTNLTADVAAALASYGDAPDRNGWTLHAGRKLYLSGLTTLTPEAAGELLKFRGRLHLSGRNLDLTPKAAQILAKSANWDGYLPGLTTLTPEFATALATCNGERLGLGGLTTLTPEAAAALAKFEGRWLTLGGLTNVSPESAAALVNYKGGLCLPDLSTLTPETAAALARRTGSLTLPGLTTLTPEAAVALAKFGGDGLFLTGLTALKPETAAALAKFRGAKLDLAVLSLAPGAATALAEFGGQKLDLHRLISLTPEAAAALANYKGALYLDALTRLTPEVASALAKSKGPWLSLGGLRAPPTPEVAAALANYKGGLTLDDLTSPQACQPITPDAMTALAKFEGEVLELPGSKYGWMKPDTWATFRAKQIEFHYHGVEGRTLAPETVAALAKQIRSSNRSLTTLSPERLAVLANYGGKEIHLDSLTELTPEAASLLAASGKWNGSLPGLKTLTPETARVLAQCGAWNGRLPQVTTISAETAKVLAECKVQRLDLSGLTTITLETARALAQCRTWNGSLPQVTTISVEIAKALAEFKGYQLTLSGLTAITPEAAAALAKCKAKVSLPHNMKLPKP